VGCALKRAELSCQLDHRSLHPAAPRDGSLHDRQQLQRVLCWHDVINIAHAGVGIKPGCQLAARQWAYGGASTSLVAHASLPPALKPGAARAAIIIRIIHPLPQCLVTCLPSHPSSSQTPSRHPPWSSALPEWTCPAMLLDPQGARYSVSTSYVGTAAAKTWIDTALVRISPCALWLLLCSGFTAATDGLGYINDSRLCASASSNNCGKQPVRPPPPCPPAGATCPPAPSPPPCPVRRCPPPPPTKQCPPPPPTQKCPPSRPPPPCPPLRCPPNPPARRCPPQPPVPKCPPQPPVPKCPPRPPVPKCPPPGAQRTATISTAIQKQQQQQQQQQPSGSAWYLLDVAFVSCVICVAKVWLSTCLCSCIHNQPSGVLFVGLLSLVCGLCMLNVVSPVPHLCPAAPPPPCPTQRCPPRPPAPRCPPAGGQQIAWQQ
jgi:hypothetical protein